MVARTLSLFLTLGLGMATAAPAVPLWSRFEFVLRSSKSYENPLQDVEVRVVFTAPSGARRVVDAFWDGGSTWRARLTPDEQGAWTFVTSSSDPQNSGLHQVSGRFVCGPAPERGNRFDLHGPVVVSKDGRHLAHADGTPFFWLADTAWNGPMWASGEDWEDYVNKRQSLMFTAVQWVATQWRGAPLGDSQKRLAYSGRERIAVNLPFFQALEKKHDVLRRYGLVSAPVMLWAIRRGPEDDVDPGVSLPEAQAILLCRYMVARWGEDPVLWLLNGDGEYRGAAAARWRTIGRGVFGGTRHAPVALHPGGLKWVMDDFEGESWLDLAGYQSAHADSEKNSAWITTGEPEVYGRRAVGKVMLSLEAPYEGPGREDLVRRNHYWSMLNGPVVGVTYGAAGVWSWSDGVSPVPGHGTSVPQSWRSALSLPAAREMAIAYLFFNRIPYWTLRPALGILAEQPGGARFVAASQSEDRSLTVVYVPADREVRLKAAALPAGSKAQLFAPKSGALFDVKGKSRDGIVTFAGPSEGDWLLLVR